MKFQLDIQYPTLDPSIKHEDKIMLIGSCFTEHMTHFMRRVKMNVQQNSHGIVFNPISVCRALTDLAKGKEYKELDLFHLDEYWHSWYHHSDFSSLDKKKALEKINTGITVQRNFLLTADYLIITLGSAFAYLLKDQNIYVSNNHRAPAQWFEKKLLSIEVIQQALQQMQDELLKLNPKLRFIYTISPVRHVRDGVIENNRSKARLLEAVHALENVYYFPAYELVIDILRDYRFYDVDMVHPNYQATAFVWDHFVRSCIDPQCLDLMQILEQIYKALHHKPKSTMSEAHAKFKKLQLEQCRNLLIQYPYLDFTNEITYFGT